MGKVDSVLRFQKQKGVDLLFCELTCGCQPQDLGLVVDEDLRQSQAMNGPLSIIVRLHTTTSFETFLLHHILTPEIQKPNGSKAIKNISSSRGKSW